MRLLLLALLATASAYDWQLYSGYQLLEVVPETPRQVKELHEIADELDWWKEPTGAGRAASVLAPPWARDWLLERFAAIGLDTKVAIEDVSLDMKAEWEAIEASRVNPAVPRAFNYSDWNTFDEYMTEIDNLAADCPHGFRCDVFEIGTTYFGRPLKMMKVHHDNGNQLHSFWLDSLIHCREWLAGATLMKVMNEMIRNYDSNTVAKQLMDNFVWYFLPVMNPDGYEYTWTDERLWRKNRSPNERNCTGKDLNRNYDYNWGDPGASPLECSYTYHGPSPASELETQAVQNYGSSVAADLRGWITIHTYGNYLLFPYGDCSVPVDIEDQVRNTDVTCAAIMGTYNTIWECGNSCEILYATSGTTNDWAKGAGVKYSYTAELRGPGFVVPASSIDLSFNEFWNGLAAYVDDAVVEPKQL